jgi:hypothetical protein
VKRAAVLVALAACGGKPKPAPPPPAPAPVVEAAYRFDWSPPCRVPATERMLRKGQNLSLRYVVSVTRISDTELKVEMVDVEPPELREVYDAFPAVIIGNDGTYVRTESLDEIIAFTIKDSPELGKGFDTPELRAQMALKFAEPWITWVGHWIDWSLAPGERHTIDLTIQGPGGDEIPFQGTVEHLGIEDGVARLRYSERMDGEALKKYMAPLLLSMSDIAPDPAEAERYFSEMKLEGYRESVYEVETSPVNLRPRRSRYDVRLDASINGEPFSRDHEWREVEFDWAKAEGCGN